MEDNFKAWEAATAEYGLEIKKEDYLSLVFNLNYDL